MKAVELNGFEGINSLRVVEVEKPRPRANQVLLEVKAAGINFAEIEMTKGRYPAGKKLPFVMGFEAAGIVVEAGSEAKNVKLGDKVTTISQAGVMPNSRLRMPASPFQFPTGSPLRRRPPSRSTACRPTLS